MSVKGKKIVVTGGSGGIGSRVVAALKAAKADLIIVDRAPPQNADTPFVAAELSTMDGIDAAGQNIADLCPDILVNLAGVQYLGPVEQQDARSVSLTYMVNLVAPVRLTQAVLPGMIQQGAGQIVNIGSILGSINYPYFVTYSSAKAGLRGFSEALRRELHGSGVGVTYIAPRAVKTGLSNAAVMQFARLTNMKLDAPEVAVRRIVRAIITGKKNVFLGFPEKLFVRVNALAPSLVDMALSSQTDKARSLFLS